MKIKKVSDLQKAQSKLNWLIYFRLQNLSEYALHGFSSSPATMAALREYNRATDELRANLKQDYMEYRMLVLSQRESARELPKSKKDIDTL